MELSTIGNESCIKWMNVDVWSTMDDPRPLISEDDLEEIRIPMLAWLRQTMWEMGIAIRLMTSGIEQSVGLTNEKKIEMQNWIKKAKEDPYLMKKFSPVSHYFVLTIKALDATNHDIKSL